MYASWPPIRLKRMHRPKAPTCNTGAAGIKGVFIKGADKAPPLLQTFPLDPSKNAPVFHDGTGNASKTDHQPGGKTMYAKDQPQTNKKGMERDAAIQIVVEGNPQRKAKRVRRVKPLRKGGISIEQFLRLLF